MSNISEHKDELLSKKIEVVKEHKDDIIAAFNLYLDNIYFLLSGVQDSDGKISQELIDNIEDTDLRKFTNELKNDIEKYENVRRKIQNDDYNLSMYEINLIGMQFFYVIKKWEKKIADLTKATDEAKNLVKIFLESVEELIS